MSCDEGTSPRSPDLLCARQEWRRVAARLRIGGIKHSFPLCFCPNNLGDKALSESGGLSVRVYTSMEKRWVSLMAHWASQKEFGYAGAWQLTRFVLVAPDRAACWGMMVLNAPRPRCCVLLPGPEQAA